VALGIQFQTLRRIYSFHILSHWVHEVSRLCNGYVSAGVITMGVVCYDYVNVCVMGRGMYV
jgi:hypothetical protein